MVKKEQTTVNLSESAQKIKVDIGIQQKEKSKSMECSVEV